MYWICICVGLSHSDRSKRTVLNCHPLQIIYRGYTLIEQRFEPSDGTSVALTMANAIVSLCKYMFRLIEYSNAEMSHHHGTLYPMYATHAHSSI